jgi:hypothetical protein
MLRKSFRKNIRQYDNTHALSKRTKSIHHAFCTHSGTSLTKFPRLLQAENTSMMNGIRDDLLRTVHSLENVHSATEHSEEEDSSQSRETKYHRLIRGFRWSIVDQMQN